MKKIRILTGIFLFVILAAFASAQGAPPSEYWGLVNGGNIADGLQVQAWIDVNSDGQLDMSGANTPDGDEVFYEMLTSDGYYNVQIGPDDTDTSVVEGGTDGDTIIVRVDGEDATPTLTWSSGSNTEVNLTISATNNPPIIDYFMPTGEEVIIDENNSKYFEIGASDPENDVLTYSWKFDDVEVSNSNNYTYDADFDSAGNYNVTVTVSDGELSTSQSWNLTVNNVNRRPAITSSPITSIDERETYSYQVTAFDPDTDTIYYALLKKPENMSINSTSGLITWNTTSEDIGEHNISIMATDGPLSDTQNYTLTVNNVNDAPVANNDAVTTDEDQSITIDVLANDEDIDGDNLSIISTTSVNHGELAIDLLIPGDIGYSLSYSPDPDFYGEEVFNYTITDGTLNSTATVIVTVNPVNDAPNLQPIGDKEVAEGEQLSFTIQADDIDGDSLTYSSEDLPMGASFTEQQFTWTPTYDQAGIYEVTFMVNDSELTDSETINITVNNAEPPRPDLIVTNLSTIPEVYDFSGNITVNFTIKNVGEADIVNEEFLTEILLLDQDLESGHIPMSVYDNNLSIGEERSYLERIPVQSFDIHNNTIYVGIYVDGDGQINETNETNNDKVLFVDTEETPPVITSEPETTIRESLLYTYMIEAFDHNEDSLSYELIASPENMTLTDNLLEWTPTQADIGEHNISIVVSDGMFNTTQNYTLTVIEMNNGPNANDDHFFVDEDNGIVMDVLANDTDADNTSLITVLTSETKNGTLTMMGNNISYMPDNNFYGEDNFTYNASDGNQSDSATVTITVLPVNDVPELSDIDNQTIEANNTIQLFINASDVDKDILSYTAEGLPPGATFENQWFNWTPGFNQSGEYNVAFRVNDSIATDSLEITITVLENNRPPVIGSTEPDYTVSLGEVFELQIEAYDPDGDELTYSFVESPEGAFIDESGFISWNTSNVNLSVNDDYQFTVSVNDSELASFVYFEVIVEDEANVSLPDTLMFEEDSSATLDLREYIFHPTYSFEDFEITFSGNDNITIEIVNGTAVFTAPQDWFGAEEVDFEVETPSGDNSQQEMIITVSPVNDAPRVLSFFPQDTNMDAEMNDTLFFNVSAFDVENDSVNFEWFVNEVSVSQTSSLTYTFSERGETSVEVLMSDETDNTSMTWSVFVPEPVVYGNFSGNTTHFETIDDPENATNIQFENDFGGVDFGSETINVSRIAQNTSIISKAVAVRNNIIGIDTDVLPEFKSKGATIKMRNVPQDYRIYYSEDFTTDPARIGNVCSSSVCSNQVYDASTGTLTFKVAHFSTYRVGKRTSAQQPKTYTPEPEIKIMSARAASHIARPGDFVQILVGLYNEGDETADDVTLTVLLPEIGLKQKYSVGDLGVDDRESRFIEVILPDDIRPGEYYIKVSARGSNDRSSKYIPIYVY